MLKMVYHKHQNLEFFVFLTALRHIETECFINIKFGENITLKLPDFQNVTHTEFPEGLVNIMSREQDFR